MSSKFNNCNNQNQQQNQNQNQNQQQQQQNKDEMSNKTNSKIKNKTRKIITLTIKKTTKTIFKKKIRHCGKFAMPCFLFFQSSKTCGFKIGVNKTV